MAKSDPRLGSKRLRSSIGWCADIRQRLLFAAKTGQTFNSCLSKINSKLVWSHVFSGLLAMSETEQFCQLKFLLTIFGLTKRDNLCHNLFKWLAISLTIFYQFYCLATGLFDITSHPQEMYYYLALELKRIIASITYVIFLKKNKHLFEFQVCFNFN